MASRIQCCMLSPVVVWPPPCSAVSAYEPWLPLSTPLGCCQSMLSATPAPALLLQNEYVGNKSAAADWDQFVRHQWLPILSLALGPHWQSKYESEVAAIIALQLSVQPPAQAAAAVAGVAPTAAAAQLPAAAKQQASSAAGTQPPPARKQAAPATAVGRTPAPPPPVAAPAVSTAPRAAALDSGFPTARPYSLECVDVDGKRRRLRRKRAASPDLCPPGDDLRQGGRGSTAGAGGGGGARSPAAAAVSTSAGPLPVGSAAGAESASSPELPAQGQAAVAVECAQPESAAPTAVQRVTAQVSGLSLETEAEDGQQGGGSPVPYLAAALELENLQIRCSAKQAGQGQQQEGEQQEEQHGQQRQGEQQPEQRKPARPPSPAGWQEEAAMLPPSGGEAASSSANNGGSSGAACNGADSTGGGIASVVAAVQAAVANPPPLASTPGGELLQRSLLGSLSLVQDLSARIVADLRRVARDRGLTLPQQVCDSGPLPLSMLLGGALVDRTDLLGRAALHVAAATGRAEVVRQLAAAGCALNKPLPMDYRWEGGPSCARLPVCPSCIWSLVHRAGT